MGSEKIKRSLAIPGANLGPAEIRCAQISLTSVQVKALRATPQTLVPAPGPGLALQVIGGTVIYDYAAVFTETADNLVVRYTNGAGAAASAVIETTGFLDQTSSAAESWFRRRRSPPSTRLFLRSRVSMTRVQHLAAMAAIAIGPPSPTLVMSGLHQGWTRRPGGVETPAHQIGRAHV